MNDSLDKDAAGGDELSLALSMVAHDLRHPLQVIAASLGLLGRSDLPDAKRARYVTTVRRAVDQLNRLVGDLDLVAEVGQGRQRLDPAPTELVKLLEQALHDQARLAGDETPRVKVEAPQDLPRVLADQRATIRVIARVADLALKRLPSDASVSVRLFEDAGGAVALRADIAGLRENSTELTLVERLVTAQGGTVGLEPGGEGTTTLTVTLPRAPGP